MENQENLKNEEIEMSEDEIKEFMQGNPTRLEVANYINSLLEEKYMPLIQEQINALKLGNMVTQALLLQKGICSGEDIENMISQLSKSLKEETKQEQ